MNIYNYSQITNEYLSTKEARLDPIDQQPMLPAYSTAVTIPTIPTGFAVVFNGTTWDLLEDHRGDTVYDTDTKEQLAYGEIGIIDSQYTTIAPLEFSTWNGNAWIVDLSLAKSENIKEIDVTAEARRLLYITNGVGQSLVYQKKAAEAAKYIDAGSPGDLIPYPFIEAESIALGDTPTNAANIILSAENLMVVKGAAIEKLRIKVKIDINAALNVSSIDSIVDTYTTAINLI